MENAPAPTVSFDPMVDQYANAPKPAGSVYLRVPGETPAGETLALYEPEKMIARAYLAHHARATNDLRRHASVRTLRQFSVRLAMSSVVVDVDTGRYYVCLRDDEGAPVAVWRILPDGKLKPMLRPPSPESCRDVPVGRPWLAGDEEAW